MQRRAWTLFDKSAWGDGPWRDEPDKVQWQDEVTGLPCLIVRSWFSSGALCGYVGVPPGHPYHSKEYSEDGPADLECHMGLTFAGECMPLGEAPARLDEVLPTMRGIRPIEGADLREARVCHTPDPGEPDNVWWFGFDCSHAWDVSPGMDYLLHKMSEATMTDLDQLKTPWDMRATYKTIDYVAEVCGELAKQLRDVAST